MDPTSEEEVCSASSIVMSVLPNGKVSSVIKLGYGSIQPNTFIKMLQVIILLFIVNKLILYTYMCKV